MTIDLASRLGRVKPSPTLAVTALAARLRSEGRDIIGLGAGEPDFDTPQHIKDAAVAAIAAGKTKYTAVDGIPELKAAICAKLKGENQLEYAPSQILVSCGGKQSCYNLCMALLNDGDESIIPAPYWVSYPDMVLLAGGEPVIVPCGGDSRFKITAAQLAAAITPRTRLLWLNSPSNPTGMAYSLDELKALGEVLRRHPQVVIATDDMYEHIIWRDEPFCNILNACPDLADRTLVLNGVSKAWSMTGWRIGYAAGPEQLIGGMRKVQSQSTSNPCSISQWASVAALEDDRSEVGRMRDEFKIRHDYVVGALNEIAGLSCEPGDGAFYAFPDASEAIAKLGEENDTTLCSRLLDEAGIAAVPGMAFGSPGNLRLSFATDLGSLEEAIRRLAKALN